MKKFWLWWWVLWLLNWFWVGLSIGNFYYLYHHFSIWKLILYPVLLGLNLWALHALKSLKHRWIQEQAE